MQKKTRKTDTSRKEETADADENLISLAPLDFETALEDLLRVKPVDNAELKKSAPKKKSKPKTKK